MQHIETPKQTLKSENAYEKTLILVCAPDYLGGVPERILRRCFLNSKTVTIIGSKLFVGEYELGDHSFVMYPKGHYITYTQSTELWSFPARKTFQKVDWITETSHSGAFYYVRWGWGGKEDGYYRGVVDVMPLNITKNIPHSILYDIQPK